MALKEYEADTDLFTDENKASSERSSIDSDSGIDISGPLYELTKWQFVVLISAILLSNFSTAIDSGLSASAHVAIASSFKRTNLSTWPVNAFLVTSLTFQPLFARVSDHVGRRIPYLLASGILSLGLTLSATASSWTGLIAARALCGLGVAGVMTMGSVLLTDVVGLMKRGHYQSINYVVYGAGSAIGSGIGGALVQNLGWEWVYKVQIPISVVAFVLLAITVPKPIHLTRNMDIEGRSDALGFPRNLDWRGSIFLMLSLVSLFSFLTTGGNIMPWTHPLVILAGISFTIFSALFIMAEQKASKPILPLDLLFKFPTRNIILSGFLFSFINYAAMYNTTLFFQTVLLNTPEAASTRLIIPSVSFTLSSALTGSLIAHFKTPLPTLRISQFLLLGGTIGLVLMSSLRSFFKITSPWPYNIMLALPAAGVGMMAPSVVLTLLNMANSAEHAVENGSLIMMRSLGVFVATAVSSSTLQNIFQAYFASYHYDEKTRIALENTRQNVELILELEEPLKSQVMAAYGYGFTAVFSLCTIAATVLIMSLARVKIRGFREREDGEKGGRF